MKVNIGKITWEVRFVSANDPLLDGTDGRFYNGVCCNTQHLIVISANIDEFQTKDTTIHEITHAYINMFLLRKTTFDNEEVADFMERYAEDILATANEILNERRKEVNP